MEKCWVRSAVKADRINKEVNHAYTMERYTKPTFKEIARHPLVYALLFIGSIASFFVYRYTGVANRRTDDCLEEKKELREELREVRQENTLLYRELLIKQGVIDALPDKADSLLKTKKNEKY